MRPRTVVSSSCHESSAARLYLVSQIGMLDGGMQLTLAIVQLNNAAKTNSSSSSSSFLDP